jgi:hypothetical protein
MTKYETSSSNISSQKYETQFFSAIGVSKIRFFKLVFITTFCEYSANLKYFTQYMSNGKLFSFKNKMVNH